VKGLQCFFWKGDEKVTRKGEKRLRKFRGGEQTSVTHRKAQLKSRKIERKKVGEWTQSMKSVRGADET